MGNIGIWELIIIAILVVIIFGGRKLPELGRGLGQGLANFRRAVSDPDKAPDGPATAKKDAAANHQAHSDEESSTNIPRADQEK